MRAKLLLAATAAALLAGTTLASAQYATPYPAQYAGQTYMYIQSRDYVESVHGIPYQVYRRQAYPGYAGYGTYGYAPRYNNRYYSGY